MGQETNITINGEVIKVTAEQAMYLKHAALAMAGNTASFKILATERCARRGNLPPPPTAQELAEEEAEMEKRKALAARLVSLLEEKVQEKRRDVSGRNGKLRSRISARIRVMRKSWADVAGFCGQ